LVDEIILCDSLSPVKAGVVQRPGTAVLTTARNCWSAVYLHVTFHWELFYDAHSTPNRIGLQKLILALPCLPAVSSQRSPGLFTDCNSLQHAI